MAPEDELLDEARTRTGLADFGEDTYREGLARLVRALRDEAHLNELGELALRERILGLLTQRLQIEDWHRRHPEIADEPIDRPLIVLGLPRTSSTALSFLLAEDPGTRTLRRYEAGAPCPPPSTVTGEDPRIAAAAFELEMQQQMSPRSLALVPQTATGPAECQDLMGLTFKAQYFQALAQVPSYADWLVDADLDATYRYERRALQVLQWGEPTRPWRLKCPTHLLFLDALDRAFPDARFVMTHRDPAEVIPSVADVYAEVGGQFTDALDLHRIGAMNVRQWAVGMERAMAFRDAGNDHRFFDLDFRAVQRDPLGEVARLYAWLGEPVSPTFEAGMRRWWDEWAATRTPNVHPDPSTFGLDLDEVRRRFAGYTARMAEWTADPGTAVR